MGTESCLREPADDDANTLAGAIAAESELGRILEVSLNEIYIFDADTLKFLCVNRGARENLGYSIAELRELTPADIKPKFTEEQFSRYIERLRQGETDQLKFETVHRRKDGSDYDVEVHLQLDTYHGRAAFIAIILDITERKALEGKLFTVSEDERRSIGREIHDDLCQRLFGAGCLIKVLQQKSSDAPQELREHITELDKLIGSANAHARALAHGLMPVTLESDGLMGALGDLAAVTTKTCGIPCQFRCEHPVLIDDNDMAIQLFRIAQEAVRNAAHHGTPSKIGITLSELANEVVIEIRDDGQGIPPADERKEGMGLLTMSHRARSLGGHCDFHNNSGAVVTCSVPHRASA